MNDKAKKLFDEAMEANLTGNTARASDLLKQVVEEDPNNVTAWLELSKLLTDRDERRMALTTVRQLDPNNDYAAAELEALEKSAPVEDQSEIAPGIPRKLARTIALGLAAYTLVVCGATFLIISAINGQKAAREAEVALLNLNQAQTQTAIAVNATVAVETATQAAAEANATLLVQVSPTPSPTPTPRRTLPPGEHRHPDAHRSHVPRAGCAAAAGRDAVCVGRARCALGRVFAASRLSNGAGGRVRGGRA